MVQHHETNPGKWAAVNVIPLPLADTSDVTLSRDMGAWVVRVLGQFYFVMQMCRRYFPVTRDSIEVRATPRLLGLARSSGIRVSCFFL